MLSALPGPGVRVPKMGAGHGDQFPSLVPEGPGGRPPSLARFEGSLPDEGVAGGRGERRGGHPLEGRGVGVGGGLLVLGGAEGRGISGGKGASRGKTGEPQFNAFCKIRNLI